MNVDTSKKRDTMLLSFPREIGLRRAACSSRQNFDDYVNKVNGRASCYTSLYSFQRAEPSRPWKMDIASVIMDRAWWDFDIEEDGSLDDVKLDAAELINRLDGDVRTVFTGRGFHVHQMFDKPVMGTSIAKHIDRYERKMAKGLKSLDGVGHPQKLTRIPDTYNPTREKWAVNIDTEEFAANPIAYNIPPKPESRFKDLDPFRGTPKHSDFSITKWIAANPQIDVTFSSVMHEKVGSAGQIPIPPCIEQAIAHENPKHAPRLALAYHLYENLRWFVPPASLTSQQKDEITTEMVDFISTLGWRDFNPSESRMHVRSILDHENTPTCAWLSAKIGCPGSCWRDDGTRR